MKSCDLVQSFTNNSGGIQTYIRAKQRHVAGREGEHHVLIVPGERDEVLREGPLTTYTVAGPYVPGCKPYRFIYRLDKIHEILAAETPDVIELANPYLQPWVAFNHRRGRETLVVGHYHADFPRAYGQAFMSRRLGGTPGRLAERLCERYACAVYNRCDLTLTASPRMQEALKTMGVTNARLIRLGVDLETFSPRRRDRMAWLPLGIGEDEPVLIYCGRLDSEKNSGLLLRAFRCLPEALGAHLVVVGEGALRLDFEAAARDHERIHVLSYETDRVKLATLLASADVYVTTGAHETFGLSVLEAQACGLPVVGVDAGALRDRVLPGLGLLGPVDDERAMADNIRRILLGGASRMGERARRRVEATYSWRSACADVYDIYREAAAGERVCSAGPVCEGAV